MNKLLTLLLTLFFSFSSLFADEGMWVPFLIKDRIADMQQRGLKLSAEDIYSVNQACLKDAIVHFGGGCTGELVSNEGLLVTNHHCGFSQIQSHSSVEHDYLKDGFWAMSREEELPNKGLTVTFLKKMEDVTSKVLQGTKDGQSEEERASIIAKNIKKIVSEYTNGTHYSAKVEPFYYGNQYFIFVNEVFEDVRLVGAPPSSIGKFGGDTDNWMWPRHTGDFSIFRIYAGKDNKPAPYSKENVPYKPKRFFKINAGGVKEGDFTFVYGYPGRTQQYLFSDAVEYISDISNPHKIALRTLRLDIQKKYMDKSQEVRIKYASKNASVSNAWKKWQGERNGILRLKVAQAKREFQQGFDVWAKENNRYVGLMDSFKEIYAAIKPLNFATDYYNEAIRVNEILKIASGVNAAIAKATKGGQNYSAIVKGQLEQFFKDYYLPIDKESFIALLKEYNRSVPAVYQPQFYKEMMIKEGSEERLVDYIFANSIFAEPQRAYSALEGGEFVERVKNDPATLFANGFAEFFRDSVKAQYDSLNGQLTTMYREYMRGMMEYDKNRSFYPDANSTLRITYGVVKGYSPKDAVIYNYFSTLDGIIEKDNPEIYDYDIPQKLRDLYAAKDFGSWGVNGTVPVCFVATNHTSGGNSGSPVIDANGNLLGLNFDRAWEGTMSDIVYDPLVCRNITLDIRYLLFVVDKVAGAGHLIEEMEIVN